MQPQVELVERHRRRRHQVICDFLDKQAAPVERVRRDLIRGLNEPDKGRRGLTASQTLRALVLGMAKSGALPTDAVLRAAHGMAAASGDLNTFALGRSAVAALFAQLAGTPNVQPGMTYNRAPDGRWIASSVIGKGAAGQAGVHRGDVLVSKTLWPLILTQTLVVVRKHEKPAVAPKVESRHAGVDR